MNNPFFNKDTLAGYLIGLAVHIYAYCKNEVVGAILFGLGLLTICAFKLSLFTGKVGESKFEDISDCIYIFLGNLAGVSIALLLFEYLSIPLPYLSAGIVCGSLMQLGVALYSKHPWATVMCVAAFLLSDAKHCIAMFYVPRFESAEWWLTLLYVIIGNIIGAKIIASGGVRKEVSNEN